MNNLFPRAPHIVVVGGGYAGLPCAVQLGRKLRKFTANARVRLTLINNEPRQELTCDLHRTLRTGASQTFNFQPLLKRLHVNFVEGTVSELRPEQRTLRVRGENRGEISYDHLVLAAGTKAMLPPIEGLEDAMRESEQGDKRIFSFRNNMQVQALRLALRRQNWGADGPPASGRDVFVVVLGAGATGIEVAGELASLRGKNFRMRVVLVDDQNSLLPTFSPIARRVLRRELKRMQIETILGSPATRVTPHEIHIGNGQIVPWNLLVLCTGARINARFTEPFGPSASKLGLHVKKNFQIENFRDHYAIGDVAHAVEADAARGKALPKLAQFAAQEGSYLAQLIADQVASGFAFGRGADEFKLRDWGYLVSLGPHSGVGRLGPALQNPLTRLISPFVVGPAVDQLKQAATLRYLGELKIKSLF